MANQIESMKTLLDRAHIKAVEDFNSKLKKMSDAIKIHADDKDS